MNRCTECETIEGKVEETEDGILICKECGGEDCIKFYDEDYGKDR